MIRQAHVAQKGQAQCLYFPNWKVRRRPQLTRKAPAKVSDEQVRTLEGILLCKRLSVLQIAEKFPRFLQMSPADLSKRLVTIKACLPGLDVSDLIKAQPSLFLETDPAALATQICSSYEMLSQELPASVDIDEVVQDQPRVLFQSPTALASALHYIKYLKLDHIEPADTARLLQLYDQSAQTPQPVLWLEFLGRRCTDGLADAMRAVLPKLQ